MTYVDKLKNEEDLENENDLKNEEDLKILPQKIPFAQIDLRNNQHQRSWGQNNFGVQNKL